MRFEMTVPDARFLYESRRHDVISISGTDVEAWLFHCHDSTSAATFQPRLSAAWLDERRVTLMLDDSLLQVCSKMGHTIWPDTPSGKGKPKQTLPFTLPLCEFHSHWVRGIGIGYETFCEVIAAARVEA